MVAQPASPHCCIPPRSTQEEPVAIRLGWRVLRASSLAGSRLFTKNLGASCSLDPARAQELLFPVSPLLCSTWSEIMISCREKPGARSRLVCLSALSWEILSAALEKVPSAGRKAWFRHILSQHPSAAFYGILSNFHIETDITDNTSHIWLLLPYFQGATFAILYFYLYFHSLDLFYRTLNFPCSIFTPAGSIWWPNPSPISFPPTSSPPSPSCLIVSCPPHVTLRTWYST